MKYFTPLLPFLHFPPSSLGMGVWAVAGIASSKMEQNRYLVIVISPLI